jgi:hypothetical protein
MKHERLTILWIQYPLVNSFSQYKGGIMPDRLRGIGFGLENAALRALLHTNKPTDMMPLSYSPEFEPI